MQMSSFRSRVYSVVKKIPRSKVLTYTMIAHYCGTPHAARAVGNALNRNRLRAVPCHRVIRSDGIPGGYAWGSIQKIKMLKKEGVLFAGSKVDPRSLFVISKL